jgi:hypothetical protein
MLCLLCCLVAFTQLAAQDVRDTLIGNFLPPAIPPSVFAVETTEDMSLDGKLTEVVWQRAPIIDDFFRQEPRQGGESPLNRIRNLGINKVDVDIAIYTVGCRLAANPRMQLSAFYQYNSFDERGRWNVRGSWEFAPLSFVYLVFNENDFKQTDSRNRSVINKISYLRQF